MNPTTRDLFLPNEDPAVFFEILHEAFIICQPATQFDASRVVNAVKAYWFLERCGRIVKEYESSLRRQKPNKKTWTLQERRFLTLFRRYRASAKRSLQLAFDSLKYIRQDQYCWPRLWHDCQNAFAHQARYQKAA